MGDRGTLRLMIFVDGDNLTVRCQSMMSDGAYLGSRVEHERDVFVWTPRIDRLIPALGNMRLVRAYYYTSVAGDENRLQEVVQVLQSEISGTLYPVVFKKKKGSDRAKGIYIQMTTDILSNVYRDNLDVACLVSGNRDFELVVEEVIRRGKNAYIAALSSGFSEPLRRLGDKFIDLDRVFFEQRLWGLEPGTIKADDNTSTFCFPEPYLCCVETWNGGKIRR